jgi:phosphohistidine phosphatase SixA
VKLYTVRHALPDYGDWDGSIATKPDDPPLSDEGVEAVKALAQWILDSGDIPNAIWASPKLRTQETAEIIRDTLGLPSVVLRGSMGSEMSIRKMVLKACADKDVTKLMLVSHHESVAHGLVNLNGGDPTPHSDILAMAEMRIYKVKRKTGTWDEVLRVPPSDLKGWDRY